MGVSAARVAVLAEWMAAIGGAEKVTRELLAIFPQAHLWTLAGGRGEKAAALRSPICNLRFPDRTDRRVLAAVATIAWRRGTFRAADYDLVLSSHHLQTHTAATGDVPHLSYVHSPARYVWFPDVDGRARSPLARALTKKIKSHDMRAASRVTAYAANSRTTASRLRQVWERDARVIHPPVDVSRWTMPPRHAPRRHLLAVSRFVPYKRLDLTIKVAEGLGLPLVIAGAGPQERELKQLASEARVQVKVVVGVSDRELLELFQGASALLYPGVEDFGLVPVEAMACGTPVVALGQGGATETVTDGVSGRLVSGHQLEDWLIAVRDAITLNPHDCRRVASSFGRDVFATQVRDWAKPWLP